MIAELITRLRFLVARKKRNEVDEELAFHLEQAIAAKLAAGLPEPEARRQALIEFGGVERAREQCERQRPGWQMSAAAQDFRYEMRVLRKSPGFVAAAIFTLAMAIGANAVVLGVMNALILHPVNVPRAGNLYALDHQQGDGWESYPNYEDLRDRNRSFDGLAATALSQVALDTGKDPSRLWGFEVTENYFDTLGIQPYLGRLFHASDEHGFDSAPAIVLSYGYWHSHFHDDRNVVGRVVRVNSHPYTLLGVTPPGFRGTFVFFAPNFYVPMVDHNQISGDNRLNQRNVRMIIQVVGHLKPGVTKGQAVADLNGIGQVLAKSYPDVDAHESFTLVRPSMPQGLGRPMRAFVTALMVLASLILLAACANLGSLFAARAADRGREVALRLALGSSRRRILQQFFTEAVLISTAGGTVGLLASIGLLHQLDAWQPFSSVPIHIPAQPDANVYLAAFALAVVSALLFGIVPVRHVLRTNPYEVVKAGTGGRSGKRIAARDILVAVQIAICAVLVTSSMVAVRGLLRSLHSDLGVEPKNAMLVETNLNEAGYKPENILPMQRRMLDTLTAIPGVQHAGLVSFPPLGRGGSWRADVFRDGATDLREANVAANSYMYVISPDYLRAAGTTLLEGRMFDWRDGKDAPKVAIVNREFAAKVLGSTSNAIGRYFKTANGTREQVVGMVEDGRYLSLTEDKQPAMFFPLAQEDPLGEQWLIVRSARDPQPLSAEVKSRLRGLDAQLPLDIVMWPRELDFTFFPARMATLSLGVLGIMGAMLSITGIFGMAAYSVSRRMRELGIRIALGAPRREVLMAALGRACKLLFYGSGAGLLLGLLATRVLAFIVYQATPRDPLVLVGTVLAMLLVGMVAAWIPAQRALGADPLVLLREE
jgi:predicted permease